MVFRMLWLILLAALLGPSSAFADPPTWVGRISLVEGSVFLRQQGQQGEGPAELNWPVSTGTDLYTDGNGRAEVQLGSSTFRLAGNSAVAFTAVDDRRIAVQLNGGSLTVTARDPDQAAEIEISAAAGQIRLGDRGRYRIDAMGDEGDLRVASLDGIAYIYRSGGEMAVPGGRQGVVYGRGGWFEEALRLDAFDDWNAMRDAVGARGQARRYVSPRMTGHEDLDQYGDWSRSADYGTVWYPRGLPADWAPYRHGRWAWIAPWGWTWVDEAPWGFAPFHYGRWAHIRGRWAWVPGTYVAQPVYAPALVAWMGSPGWSVNFGYGPAPALGLFPLGPREYFYPDYRYSPVYLRQINKDQGHTAAPPPPPAQPTIHGPPAKRLRTALANGTIPQQAVTVVPANTVSTGSPVAPAVLPKPDPKVLSRAPVTVQTPAVAKVAPAASALRPQPTDVRSKAAVAGASLGAPGVQPKAPAPGQAPAAVTNPPVAGTAPQPATAPRSINPPPQAAPALVPGSNTSLRPPPGTPAQVLVRPESSPQPRISPKTVERSVPVQPAQATSAPPTPVPGAPGAAGRKAEIANPAQPAGQPPKPAVAGPRPAVPTQPLGTGSPSRPVPPPSAAPRIEAARPAPIQVPAKPAATVIPAAPPTPPVIAPAPAVTGPPARRILMAPSMQPGAAPPAAAQPSKPSPPPPSPPPPRAIGSPPPPISSPPPSLSRPMANPAPAMAAPAPKVVAPSPSSPPAIRPAPAPAPAPAAAPPGKGGQKSQPGK